MVALEHRIAAVFLGVALALLSPGFHACAQFDFLTLAPGTTELDLPQTSKALARVNRIVSAYRELPPQQQQLWTERVVTPHIDAQVPLEQDLVEGLFALFESEDVQRSDECWQLWHDAMGILTVALPGSTRVAAAARRVLQADLPETIAFMPHENLIAAAHVALQATGRSEDLDFMLSTERAEFWAGRMANCTLEDSSSMFKNEPDRVLLTLRCKAPSVLSKNQPEVAVSFIESILRTETNVAYRAHLEWILDKARIRVAGRSPWGNIDVVPFGDPFLESLSPGPPPTVLDAHPVLNYTHMASLQPGLGAFLKAGVISQSMFEQCQVLADLQGHGYEEKIQACRALRAVPDLPFELERWITLEHVLLAGSLNLPDEMHAVARDWLARYPADWEHLPEEWQARRYGEINANVYLRGYLAHVYCYVGNEQLNWPMAERLRMLKDVMEPISEVENPEEQDVFFAQLFYANVLETLTEKWAMEERRALQGAEEKARFQEQVRASEEALAQKTMALYQTYEGVLQGIAEKPARAEYARGIIRNPQALLDIVAKRKQTLEQRMSMREQLRTAQEQAEAANLTESVWQDLTTEAGE